jgi:hypothetical protein
MLLSATEIIEDFRGGSREKRVPDTPDTFPQSVIAGWAWGMYQTVCHQ